MEKFEGNRIDEMTQALCATLGYDCKNNSSQPRALAEDTVLNDRYVISEVIGKGSFGITYLAYDSIDKKSVAVKEYYPYGIAVRSSDDITIEPLGNANKTAFEEGVEKFCSEGSYIARFRSSSEIMGIYSAFCENGTAYYVMEYFNGITLKEYVAEYGKLTPAQAVYIAVRIAEAFAVIHTDGVLHRDVSPDNIMLCQNGEVKLIDFGAARQFVDCIDGLSVIVKQGFTPPEQYQRGGKQGAWTDIYSLGASLFYGLTMKTPDSPTARLENDNRFIEDALSISQPLRDIIIKAASVKREERYQNGNELISALGNSGIAEDGFADMLVKHKKGSTMKTSDIELEIKRAEQFDTKLIEANSPPEFSVLINTILDEKGVKRSDLIRKLNYDRNYGYQILNGTRIPTKRQIIEIALCVGICTEQLQQLLKICNREILYVRNLEDAKVMYALEHNYKFDKAIEFIWGDEY